MIREMETKVAMESDGDFESVSQRVMRMELNFTEITMLDGIALVLSGFSWNSHEWI